MEGLVKTVFLIVAVSLVVLFWATSNPKSADSVREQVVEGAEKAVDAGKDIAENLTDK